MSRGTRRVVATIRSLKDRGWTERAIAERICVSVRTIYRYGHGETTPQSEYILRALEELQHQPAPVAA